MSEFRIGFGFDAHAFGPGNHVWLGGVRIAHDRGVIAHSDGDVLLHALCDAWLGALGEGDLGQHFPDTDPRYRSIASLKLLAAVRALSESAGFRVGNADLTLIAETPRLAPHRDAIRRGIAEALGVMPDRVNVKATTTEGLGFAGRGEGLAAQAAILLRSD